MPIGVSCRETRQEFRERDRESEGLDDSRYVLCGRLLDGRLLDGAKFFC
jgi:hypothetical protein